MQTSSRILKFLLSATILSAGSAPLRAQPIVASRSAANGWFSGTIAETQTTSCQSVINGTPTNEPGIGSFVSYQSNPVTGATYYLSVYISGLGNPCYGTNVFVDIQLPASTSLAVSVQNPIVYLYDGVALSAAESPQFLSTSPKTAGALMIASPNSDKLWPLAQGHNFEFLIPVVTSSPLSGSAFQANVFGIDGIYDQWIRPTVNLLVVAGAPSITYPSPSTTAITGTTAHSVANLYSAGLAGTAYFDLGTTTSYGTFHEAAEIPLSGGPNFQVYDDWSPLSPGTTYHWRLTFTPTGGLTYYGTDQTFTTSGTSSVQSGSVGSIESPSLPVTDVLGRIRSGRTSPGQGVSDRSGVEIRIDPAGASASGTVEIH